MLNINKETLIERIKNEEGFSSKAYWDNKQYTNGYGTEAKYKDEIISEQEAEKRLIDAINRSKAELIKVFPNLRLTSNRKEALIDMIFNLGLPTFLTFKNMIRAIKKEEWYRAAFEAYDSKWYGQVGDRAKRIIKELAKG